MKKLIRLVNNNIQEIRHRLRIKKQAKETRRLRQEKRSDYDRWKRSEQLFEDWNQRTNMLASMVNPGAKVIEFGAGNKVLKDLLPEGCEYTGSDLMSRDPETLECDLNETISIDLSVFDTAVFSGVLEYVYDIDAVIKQFPKGLKDVLLSYSCSDISNANRLENGWLSDYSKKDIESVFKKYNYNVVEYTIWRNQSLYKLTKEGNDKIQ